MTRQIPRETRALRQAPAFLLAFLFSASAGPDDPPTRRVAAVVTEYRHNSHADMIVSRLLLIVVFFLVFVPTGMLLRLSGRDPLTRRFESARSTYWLPRTPMRHPRDYFRQF